MEGQRITIGVQPVGTAKPAAKFFVETKTEAGGRFQLCIDPRRGQDTRAKPWEGKAASGIEGLYEVVCETFDAADLAHARSRPLYFDLRRKQSPVGVLPAKAARPIDIEPGLAARAARSADGEGGEPRRTGVKAPPGRTEAHGAGKPHRSRQPRNSQAGSDRIG
jgi:hypothetical protein